MTGTEQLRVVLIFCSLLPWPVGAQDVPRDATWERPGVVVAVNGMPLRAEPDLDSEFIARPPLMWPVTVLQEMGPEVIVNGRRDRWVRVTVPECADGACETYRAGWVLDSFLGFDDRFERLDGIEPTTLTDYDGRNVIAYGVQANGEFSRWSAVCIPGMCSPEPESRSKCLQVETRRGAFCVMTGVLYRYRDLVRGRDAAGEWLPFGLSVSSSGRLCPLGPLRRVDWMGGYIEICIYSDQEPSAAVEADMDAQRKRLALVAADLVSLRAEPSEDAVITGRVPLGTTVAVYPPAGSLGSVDGWHGRWVRPSVLRCQRVVDGCLERSSGWLIDGVLAFEDRLLPMTGWREGIIGGRRGNRTFRYRTARDGTVRFTETCDDPAECRETTASGRLYRYNNLIVAKFGSSGRVDVLYIDEDGALCLPEMADGSVSYEFRDGRPSRCDR